MPTAKEGRQGGRGEETAAVRRTVSRWFVELIPFVDAAVEGISGCRSTSGSIGECMDKIIERIERKAGVPGLVSILKERLVISGIGSERLCREFGDGKLPRV
jgi:hypothetical protein